tara:strand:- start:10004 stop:11632 length:1629 start_codon:yes stop_codon:yes gene_type:complete
MVNDVKTKSKSLFSKKFRKIYIHNFRNLAVIFIIFSQLSCSPIKENTRIVIASAGKIDSLDPAQANTLRSLQLISGLGDPLYRINSKGILEPRLAKELPQISNNGLSITIKLRENILFHDGTPFTSEAMAFSLKRFINIGTQNYVIAGRIKNVETPDKYILKINLNKPSTSINGLLTSINLTPVSPKAYSNHKDKFLNKDFVGTGPYKLVNFQTEKQRLEPFLKYWDKKPQNNGIDYINYRNSSSLYGAIINGDVDVLLSNSIEDGQRLSLSRKSKKGELIESVGPAMEIGYLTLKSNIEPFKDKVIRQAVSYSINRKLITEKVSYGLREPLYSIIPPILKRKEFSPWPSYDPILAKELLLKSGFCNDKKLIIPLTFRSNVPADKLLALTWQEQIKRDLSDCMEIEINGVESTTVYKQLSDGSYPSVILDWTGAYPDPEAYLSPLLSCEEISGNICQKGEAVFSGSFWASSILQNALEKSENLKGLERLKQLNKVETIAANGGAYIPIWLVKPRAWARLNINQPEFDGSGLVILKNLKKSSE